MGMLRAEGDLRGDRPAGRHQREGGHREGGREGGHTPTPPTVPQEGDEGKEATHYGKGIPGSTITFGSTCTKFHCMTFTSRTQKIL